MRRWRYVMTLFGLTMASGVGQTGAQAAALPFSFEAVNAAVFNASAPAPATLEAEGSLYVEAPHAGAEPSEPLPLLDGEDAPATADVAEGEVATSIPDPLIIKVQVLLDRANVSPGVVDGFDGGNVQKAIAAFERQRGLPVDGLLDAEVYSALAVYDNRPVMGYYRISEQDVAGPFVGEIPADYAEQAAMETLGFTTPEEMFAEMFHMDIDLLLDLNPGVDFGVAGTDIVVVDPFSDDMAVTLARIEVDKSTGALRAFDAQGALVVFYPATIGSAENSSPSGTHIVQAVAPNPIYYYNPSVNFQQGDNDQSLELPPGPNNPVGSTWIDLSEPTYGIHGTPEPSAIDKTASHGCVRLTNWDAKELSGLVMEGLEVVFVE